MSNQPNGSNVLGKVILVAAVLDVIWAVIVATFGVSVLSMIGGAAGASGAAATTAGVLGWIITFVIALFQGAIFMVVIGVFVIVFAALFGGKRR